MDRHHIIDALQKQSENFFPIFDPQIKGNK